MTNQVLINSNALQIPLAPDSVHCVVTSPPYWTLRSYGVGVENGELGSETNLHEYVENVVKVFREVRRVLRPDGTLWLNIGDSYATRLKGNGKGSLNWKTGGDVKPKDGTVSNVKRSRSGLKVKDLCGVPERVVIALQDDGWYWRSVNIWWKPNAMPENVTDRPSRDHEPVYILTKSARYYYDPEAVKVPVKRTWDASNGGSFSPKGKHKIYGGYREDKGGEYPECTGFRNLRTVWEIPTSQYLGSHFATFPVGLPEICIKAGTSEKGCCPICGKPWKRIRKKVGKFQRRWSTTNADGSPYNEQDSYQNIYENVGWKPGCDHDHDPVPCKVFDPFVGSGSTLLAARKLNRVGYGTDLSLQYLVSDARSRLMLDEIEGWTDGNSAIGVESDGLFDLPLFQEIRNG